MKIELDISEVNGNLEKILRKFPDAAVQVMNNATKVVEAEAKENCPVDTGSLRSSIQSEVVREGNDIAGYIYTNEEYAPFVHFGTGIYSSKGGRDTSWKFKTRKGEWITLHGQKAQPFLQDAINSKQREVLNELKKVLDYV